MSPPRRFFRCTLPRRATALVALLTYFNAAVASPLPILKERHKDRSRPFPCQDRPCGCNNAEDFWRGCCCFTPEERLAWAHENAVTPPDFVETPTPAPPEKTTEPSSPTTETCCGTGSCSCCEKSKDKTEPCCSSPAPAPVKKNAEPTTPKKTQAPAKHRTSALPGLSALQCLGGAALAIGNGEVLPTTAAPTWQPLWNPAGWLTSSGETASDLSEPPSPPPPRISL
ncbi:MAG: hypothetical protein HY040_18130 [Planctomycetes bacterium]|nr:hypothetical protein [Planctomycetota bacterium]